MFKFYFQEPTRQNELNDLAAPVNQKLKSSSFETMIHEIFLVARD